MHFPKFAFLGRCNRRFTSFQAALMNLCKREMPEIETDLPFEFFHDLFDHFVCFSTVFIFIFPKFHQGNRSSIGTDKYISWFNNFYNLFLKRHNILSFKFYPLLYNSFPTGKLSKKPPSQTNWQEAAKNRYFN